MEHLVQRDTLQAHGDWVTSLATSPENPNLLVSGSRDKTIIAWNVTRDEEAFAHPQRSFTGHGHFVSDLTLSSDAQYILSASWDHTLRLWELNTGKCVRRFVGHSKDVLSVAFSADNRQIVSGSRDRTIKLWNTVGECKYTIEHDGHTDWVSCVRFSPSPNPLIVSAGWDKLVKVWNLADCKIKSNLVGHGGFVNTAAVSPDGSLCASGGKDGNPMLWDLTEGKLLYTLDAGSVINSLVFSPNRYWLCAATDKSIRIFDLESKKIIHDLKPDSTVGGKGPSCQALAWSADGSVLYAGYSDNAIRVWQVSSSSA